MEHAFLPPAVSGQVDRAFLFQLASGQDWSLIRWRWWRDKQSMSLHAPDEVVLTPAQNACAWFFFVMAALFVVPSSAWRCFRALPS